MGTGCRSQETLILVSDPNADCSLAVQKQGLEAHGPSALLPLVPVSPPGPGGGTGTACWAS